MTASEFKKFQQRWTSLMNWWANLLRLDEWIIKLEFYREPFEASTEDDWRVAARTTATWRYAEAVICVDAPLCANKTPEELEEIVVHELLHIKTELADPSEGPGTVDASGATERLCTEMSRALIRAKYAKA